MKGRWNWAKKSPGGCPCSARQDRTACPACLCHLLIPDGEGNGSPLQYSCLENPMDRGACWAAVCGVAQSQTRLTRLSSSSSTWLDNGSDRSEGYVSSLLVQALSTAPSTFQHHCRLSKHSQRVRWGSSLGVSPSHLRAASALPLHEL